MRFEPRLLLVWVKESSKMGHFHLGLDRVFAKNEWGDPEGCGSLWGAFTRGSRHVADCQDQDAGIL